MDIAVAVTPSQLQCVLSVPRFQHRVTILAQRDARESPDRAVIFGDQNCFAAARDRCGLFYADEFLDSFMAGRKIDLKRGSKSKLTRHRHKSATLFDDAIDSRQSESRAFVP